MNSCRYRWKKSDGLNSALQLSLFCMILCVVARANSQQVQNIHEQAIIQDIQAQTRN